MGGDAKVIVVLLGLHMLLYLKVLLDLKRIYLVSIHDVLKQLKRLKKELNEKMIREVAEP